MQVILDGHPMTDIPAQATTVEGLINAIRTVREDCLVVGLKLDGHEVADEQLFTLMQTPLTDGGTLELVTDSSRRLAAGVLAEVVEALRRVSPTSAKVAELLAAGKTPEAMGELSECLSAWNSVEQSLQTVGSLTHLGLTTGDAESPSPAALLERLREMLAMVRQHLETRDLVALADVVEYDMPPLIAQWETALLRLRESLL